MKKNDKTPTEFRDLPERIRDILWSDKTGAINGEIFKRFQLSARQENVFFDVINKIVFKQINLDQLPKALEALGINEEQTKEIAVEILKKRVLPLSDYLKVNTLLYIKKWGGEIPADELSALVKTESKGKIDADSIVMQIIKETGLELKEDILKNRFKNIVLSFIRNVRSSTEIIIVLKRPLKIGGMGLSQEIVDKTMDILQKENQQTQNISVPIRKIVSGGKAKALIKAPSKELLKAETKMLKIIPKTKTFPSLLEGKTKQPLIEKIKKIDSTKKIIGEKRDESLIEVPAKNLSKTEIKIPKIIQKAETHTSLLEEKTKQPLIEKIKKINVKEEKIAQDVEEAIKNFQPQMVSSSTSESIDQPTKERFLEEDTSEKKVEAIIEKSLNVNPENKPILSRRPEEPGKVMVGSISNYPKIYGPNEELRSISLIDWRRWDISQEAMLKVKGKIDLLAEDSLVKKAEGIKAWKESEVNRLYLEIGEESINKGKSVKETINERQKGGRKTLTEAEFNAVVGLNKSLRF